MRSGDCAVPMGLYKELTYSTGPSSVGLHLPAWTRHELLHVSSNHMSHVLMNIMLWVLTLTLIV